MKDLPSFVIGLGAGVLLMYYLDSASGGRRRALVRDKAVAAGQDVVDYAETRGKRAADQVKGMVATGTLDRATRREPESDLQLHERIRARLGRIVSHPKAVHVAVRDGRVTLTGDILSREVDTLLAEFKEMPGVMSVQNELSAHDSPQGISALQGAT